MTALVSGQYTLFATAPSLIKTINSKNPSIHLERKFVIRNLPFGVGLRKEDTELKAKIDEIVRSNLKSGKLSAIYSQWTGDTLPEEVLAGKDD